MFYEAKNFIDYREVKENPIERTIQMQYTQELDVNEYVFNLMTYIETQVSLQDSVMSQFFLEPNELSFLNVNPNYIQSSGPRSHVEQPLVRLNISIDTEI